MTSRPRFGATAARMPLVCVTDREVLVSVADVDCRHCAGPRLVCAAICQRWSSVAVLPADCARN